MERTQSQNTGNRPPSDLGATLQPALAGQHYEPFAGCAFPPRAWHSAALPLAIESIDSGEWNIVHACTGAGKTYFTAELVYASAVVRGWRVVLSVPSRDLVDQTAPKIEERLGRPVGRYYTDAKDTGHDVIVVCTKSLPELAEQLDGERIDLLIADEVHKTEAVETKLAIEALAPERAVGLTATPFRSDKAERLSLWNRVIFSYTIADALRDRVLVPHDVVRWDGSGESDLNAAALDMIREHAVGPGVASAMSIADAEEFADLLNVNGVPSAAIHSKQSKSKRLRLLSDLEAGRLSALVHVSLLAEGIDLPWLRWLCLRRPVKARVRFVQEVGRVIRVHPASGKERATVLDPHDLFTLHGISHPAALGEPEPDDSPEVEVEHDDTESRFNLMPLPRTPKLPKPVAVDVVGVWSRELLRLMEMNGLYHPDPRFHGMGAAWRRREPSDGQFGALKKLAWATKFMPDGHRMAVDAVLTTPKSLRRGVVSDLLNVLGSVLNARSECRKRGERFQWPSEFDMVPVIPQRAVEALLR